MSNVTSRARLRALVASAAAAALAACGADPAPAAQREAPAAARGTSDAAAPASATAAGGVHVEPGPAGAPARVILHGVDLTGVGHDRGDPRAPIVMVEFSDFGCPYCAQYASGTFAAVERDFVAAGKVFYKHVPFVLGMFPNGDRAARAGECAGEQDRFWPMHDSLYARQRDWKRGEDADAVLSRLASQVVPDAARWAACYRQGAPDARIRAAGEAASRLGVRATPTFFIDGQLVEGALPLPVMRNGLNALLRQRGAQ